MQPKKEIDNRTNINIKRPKIYPLMLPVVFLVALGVFSAIIISKKIGNHGASTKNISQTKQGVFSEDFQKEEIIDETGKMSQSSSQDWWVNSGGQMIIENGFGKTIQGELSAEAKWEKTYNASNPKDTDDGKHPQNIFRLVARSKWQNFEQIAYFRIKKINLSASDNRNESNGILLFNRYEDGDNLYYTGLRVDGSAIIKKKYGGKYYTMSEKKIFPGEEYDRDSNPNLLPLGKWIGLRSECRNTADGDVDIRLYFKEEGNADWTLAVSVRDDGRKEYGKNILSDEGYAGIRTDFMDVEFMNYKISAIN